MGLQPTPLTGTVDGLNDTFTVPEAYQLGTLELSADGKVLLETIDYVVSGADNEIVTVTTPPTLWMAGAWLPITSFAAGHYLTRDLLQARIGGDAIYLELTDDDGDGDVDTRVEELLLTQTDALLDVSARLAGYETPLAATDLEQMLPFLLDVANYKAKTRGNRVASDDDRQLYNDAMKVFGMLAKGEYPLPSFEEAAPTQKFGFDTGASSGQKFSRDKLAVL